MAAPSPPPQTQAPETYKDPLGRTTPRGTLLGFLNAAYSHKYEIAAQYLDTHSHGKDAAALSQQLLFVLDRKLPAKLNNVSNEPLGSLTNPLDSKRELIGSVVTDNGGVDIYLQRVDRPNGESIWLFSRDTLADIPDVYDEINSAATVEDHVPDWLLRKYFGITLFAWSFFLLFLPTLYLVLSLANRLVSWALSYAFRRWAHRPDIQRITILPHPLRLLILAVTVYGTLSKISLSLVARQFGSIVAHVLLIVAFVWAMFLVTARCETYLKKRMESQGRLSSTVVLRPARRMVDLFSIVVGLMILLHALGINPSATLAGLGVGGIAIALAAQKTLENVIGGASLIMDGAVRVGDFFKMGDVSGTIEVIGLRSTRVRTLDRTLVTIPNGQMATMIMENFSARDQFWLRQVIGLEHQTPSSALSSLIGEVRNLLERDSRILTSTTRVRFLRFAESTLELEVSAYVSAQNWNQFLEIQEDLLIRVRDMLGATGVRIGYPVHAIHIKNGDELPDALLDRFPHKSSSTENAVPDMQS